MSTSENIFYSINERCGKNKENVTYEDLLQEVDLLEMTSQSIIDNLVALEINYTTNFIKKELERIADYYEISKRKKKKAELIQDIIFFEQNPENIEIVYRRKKLWSYIKEIKEDNYLKKFIIFN